MLAQSLTNWDKMGKVSSFDRTFYATPSALELSFLEASPISYRTSSVNVLLCTGIPGSCSTLDSLDLIGTCHYPFDPLGVVYSNGDVLSSENWLM